MSDSQKPDDAGALWRSQPEERRNVYLEKLLERRTNELSMKTRMDILASLGAAVFLAAGLLLRFATVAGPLVFASVGVIVMWVAIMAYRYRDWIRKPRGAGVASPGATFYRVELERRREHLANGWLWHGPVMLGTLTLLAVIVQRLAPSYRGLWNVAPFTVLLVIWVGMTIVLRRRQIAAIEREIQELASMQEP